MCITFGGIKVEIFPEEQTKAVMNVASPAVPAEVAYTQRLTAERKAFDEVYEEELFLDREAEAEAGKAIEAGLLARERLEALVWSPEHTQELRTVAMRGDAAYERLTMSGILYARRAAYNFANAAAVRGAPIMDVVQVANEALMMSIQQWDYARGYRFLTYAKPKIRGGILKFLAAQQTGSHHDFELLTSFSRTREKLSHEKQRDPSHAEIVAELGWSTARYAKYLRMTKVENIDAPKGEGDSTLADTLASTNDPVPEEAYEHSELSATLWKLLDQLNDKERKIITMRYGLDGKGGATQKVIGEHLGISQMQVSRIEHRVLNKLHSDPSLYPFGLDIYRSQEFYEMTNKKDAPK